MLIYTKCGVSVVGMVEVVDCGNILFFHLQFVTLKVSAIDAA